MSEGYVVRALDWPSHVRGEPLTSEQVRAGLEGFAAVYASALDDLAKTPEVASNGAQANAR